MKKRLLMLLAAFMAVTSVGWVHAQGTPNPELTIDGDTCYANGNPITITQSGNSGKVKITITGTEVSKEITTAGTVYGGSKDASVSSTSVTMESGEIKYLYAGGQGTLVTKKRANVEGLAYVNIKGGKISTLLVAGGKYYASTDTSAIYAAGSGVTLTNIYCGGYDQGKTTNRLETSFENSVNRIKSSTINLTNGVTVTGCLFVGGGQGYSFSKNVFATLDGITINGGLLGTGSNGRSEVVEVQAKNCTFVKATGQSDPIEIAGINRGKVESVVMSFDGCTFPKNSSDYYCYAGATYNWTNNGTQAKEIPAITKYAYWGFTNCTNTPALGLSDGLETAGMKIAGTTLKAAAFVKNPTASSDADKYTKAFTLGTNRDWILYKGLEIADATVDLKGQLNGLVYEKYNGFPNKSTWTGNYTFVYANGNDVTVQEGATNSDVKIILDSSLNMGEVDQVGVTLPVADRVVLFGGAKNATVKSSKITMKSGKLNMLFGGGYGETNGNKAEATATPAGVEGSTTINITGSSVVTNSLLGGGLYYNHSKDVMINVSGTASIGGTGNWLICGGLESGQTYGDSYAEFDKSNNTVESAMLTIDGGTYGYIAIGGTDGAKGYIKNSKATIKNATIQGGVYGNGSNGRSDKVEGTLTNCTFVKANSPIEIAAVNRGKSKEVSLTFDNCTFPTEASDIYVYLGATYHTLLGYKGSEYGIPENVNFTFKGEKAMPVVGVSDGLAEANVTLTGAKGHIAKFEISDSQSINAFTIPTGKTWTFNGGLEFATGENVATLTNNGKLNVRGIDNVVDLQSAMIQSDTIGLKAGRYSLASHLLVRKPMVIEGTITDKDSTIIEPASNWSGSDNGTKNLVRIDASNTSLKNLIVEGCKTGSGIHAFKATNVTLDNVISRNNNAAGLIVNGSTVTATNFRTSGNGWYGVNVDKGQGIEGTPVFTIGTGCSFGEDNAIYADLKNATNDDASKYVVSNDWVMTKVADKEHEYCWINAAAGGIDYAIISVPSTVVYGSANLPLISNADSTKTVKFSVQADNGFVSIKAKAGEAKYDSLVIKKPGQVAITMSVGDTTVTQSLEVLKRVITVSGITAEKKTYNGDTNVTLKTDDVKVEGFLGTGNAFSSYSGTLSSINAGNAVPVNLNATFTNSGDSAYYEVSFATVTDTVIKAKLTVTTAKPSAAIDFGATIPTFTAQESGFVNGETNAILGGKLQFDCPATSASLAGKYPVMPYGYTSDNYNIEYVADSLEIKAIAPTVELVSATVSADKSKVTAKGRIISNGGTLTTDLKGGFTVGGTAKASDLLIAKDGTFSAELSEVGNSSIEIKATAAVGSLTGTSVGTSVDLSKNLQNVNFVSELSRLTYGSTAKLSAKDFAEGAKVTFAIAEGGTSCVELVDSITIKAIKPGTATITVTAEKEGYITAIAKQTVTVEPKNLTVTPGTVTKGYDGELTATLPTFTLNGKIGEDDVTVNATSVTATFVDKNVGTNKPVVLSGDLVLGGAAAGNYTLTQPTGLKGTIEKGEDVKVIVSDVKRKYNETTLKYKLQFMTGTTDLTSAPYTGKVVVTESNGNYSVSLQNVSFPNYGNVTVESGSGEVEIEKGTPKVLTFNISTDEVGVQLLDAEGWADAVPSVVDEDSKSYAQVSYDNGTKTVRGASLTKQAAPVINWDFSAPETKALRSNAPTKAGEQIFTFGQSKILKKVNGFTYAVANTKVLTLTTNEEGDYVVNAVGVGTGAITATNANGAVAYISIKVDPASLSVSASGTDKAYDNTTSANVSLAIDNMPEGVALDLEGVTFNYASASVTNGISIVPSKPITLSGANAANYTLNDAESFKGNITPRDLTITSPISKYYDGSKTLVLSGYSAEGLIAGEAVPAVTAEFENANVGINKSVTLNTTDKNYNLVGVDDIKGNIVKSTLDATLPTGASGVENLKNNVKLVVRETTAAVTRSAVNYEPVVTTEGNGSSTVYYISGGDNDNYTVSYSSNQLGFKAEPTPPVGGGDEGDETVTISLDATTKTLPRTEEFVLKATVSPSDKTVTWSSCDPTIASVTANGNSATVKALKVGTATITAKIGDVTATCEVTVDFATGLEEALANTQVYAKQGSIYVNPIQPLQLTIVNMLGKTVYNARISSYAQIPVTNGIYIVKLTNAGNTIVTKVNVY